MDVSVNGQPFLSNLIFFGFFCFCLVTLIFKRWGSVFPVLNNRDVEGNGALGNFGGIISFVFPDGLAKGLADWEKLRW